MEIEIELSDLLVKNFSKYANHIVYERAIPLLNDGLKPVQRRVLLSMNNLGLNNNKPFKKAAKVIGDTVGQYHPHSLDGPYGALVNMTATFSARYPLGEGNGNYGSIEGDSCAAMRYCITGDTLVNTDSGLIPIEKIAETKLNSDNEIDIKVDSFNNVINESKTLFNSGEHEVYRVETESGFEIKGTSNHPLMTLTVDQNDKPCYQWKTISELKENDYLIINLNEKQLESKLNNVESWEARFLGILVSEGYISSSDVKCPYYRIGITNTDLQLIKDFRVGLENLLKRVGANSKIRENRVNAKNSSYIEMYTHSKALYDYLINERQFYFGSPTKEVPEVILSANRSIQCEFLKYLYEGDGGVYNAMLKGVFYVSQSIKLLKQIQILLANLGIFGYISSYADKRNKNYTYRIEIKEAYYIKKFAEKIGFVSDRKNKTLNEVIDYLGEHTKSISKKNYVPFISDYIRNKYRGYLTQINFDRPNRFEENKEILKKRTSKEDFELLTSLLNRNYCYQKIVSITSVGKQVVYSIKVNSKCHSFTANAFINHNTEARLSKTGDLLLGDTNEATVPWMPTYDNEGLEPKYLGGFFPNILCNYTNGIAAGVSSMIPSHNATEVITALIKTIDQVNKGKDINTKFLMKYIKGPDFPTEGIIMNPEDIESVYDNGKGKFIIRGQYTIKNKKELVFTTIPYTTNVGVIMTGLKKLKEAKLCGEFKNYSAKGTLNISIKPARGQSVDDLIKQVFKKTKLEDNFNSIFTIIYNNKVIEHMPLVSIIKKLLIHYHNIVKNKLTLELNKNNKLLFRYNNIKLAIANSAKILELIKTSDEPKSELMKLLNISEEAADYILGMKINDFTKLSQRDYDTKIEELETRNKEIKGILKNSTSILEEVKRELQNVLKKYFKNDKRLTLIGESDDKSK